MKECCDCGLQKPDIEFTTKNTYKGKIYHYPYCNECRNKRRIAKEKGHCYIEGCNGPVDSRGMCFRHYQIWRRKQTNFKAKAINPLIQVVHDPTPLSEGGFDRGAEFSKIEVNSMLKDGYFALGTRLLIKGEIKEVVLNKRGKQILVTT